MFKDARVLMYPEQGQGDFDILRRAAVAVKAIAPRTDGRIKRLDKVRREKSDCV